MVIGGRPLPVLFEALLNDNAGKKNFIPACGEPPLLQNGQREIAQKGKTTKARTAHKGRTKKARTAYKERTTKAKQRTKKEP